ncbi:MAG: S24 family peptidase [Bryobacteraceae bacterium]|jgi:SOS-response transcriptional repressor LexA|nr:S24 family peptidase [Bryobacteraceae bacterium]
MSIALDGPQAAEYVLLQVALPGRPEVNAGVMLIDPSADALYIKLRQDWNRIATPEDAQVLALLEADLQQKAKEMGARALLAWLEDTLSNTVRITAREPVVVPGGAFPRTLQTLYRRHVESRRFEVVEMRISDRHVRLYSLRAAAGPFGEDMEVQLQGWVEAPQELRETERVFLARVVGRSMEPRIPDGSLCLFRENVVGSRAGKILLIQQRGASESGGQFAVKRYESLKRPAGPDSWRHERIRLISLNPDYPVIELEPSEFEERYRVVAEFLRVLGD